MNRNVRLAGIAACLGLSLIVVGSVLGVGSLQRAALPAPIPAEADLATPEGQATPVGGTATKPPAGSIPVGEAIRELRGQGKNSPSLVVGSAGTIKTVTAAPGKTLAPKRDAFATRYAAGFGASEATKLSATATTALPGGDSVTRYQQTVGGLPVMGGELLITTNSRGGVRSAISALSGYSPKATNAKISVDAARSAAIKAIGERYAISADQIADVSVKLWLADHSKLGVKAGGLRPTYWVQLTGENDLELGDVLVDALDGSVKLAVTEHQTAKRRRVCDQNNVKVDLRYLKNYACAAGTTLNAKASTRVEGGAASSVAEVNQTYDLLGTAYDFYKSTFGIDSFDGRGAEIRATVKVCHTYDPQCPYANAFWDGKQFAFGQGWAVDDVVAHEYTHAVTEYSSGLYYWYESGAINEAFSDIMGQFIDLRTPADDTGTDSNGRNKRWLLGEALNGPTQVGAIRSMDNPNLFGDPAWYGDPYWFRATPGDDEDNGGVHYNSGVANKLAYLIADGGSLNGYTVTGIGLTKSEQLWFRVLHTLPSGAEYLDLRLAMTSACQQFIGHYGFTVADCTQVQNAIDAVRLPVFATTSQGWTECPNLFEAPSDLFFDGMDRGARNWKFSDNLHWQLIPSAGIPYTYASSGRGSINGWSSNGAGHVATAELVNSVALPAGKSAYVHFAYSLIRANAGNPAIRVYVVRQDGSRWEVGSMWHATAGYTRERFDLSNYAGESIRLQMEINDYPGTFIDWYLDDFRIYNCDGRPSAPTNAVAYVDGASIKASWGLPKFAGTGPSSWDVKVSPSPDPSQLVRSTNVGEEQLEITSFNPNLTYTITITYVSNGKIGEPVKLMVAPNPPVSCQSRLLTPFTLELRRPAPGTPQPPCAPRRFVPRR